MNNSKLKIGDVVFLNFRNTYRAFKIVEETKTLFRMKEVPQTSANRKSVSIYKDTGEVKSDRYSGYKVMSYEELDEVFKGDFPSEIKALQHLLKKPLKSEREIVKEDLRECFDKALFELSTIELTELKLFLENKLK